MGWRYNNITNCLNLARIQIEKVGYTCGGKDSSNMYPYNESKGVNKEQTEKAVGYIKNALEKGVPVVVGVDDEDGSPGNYDKTTDHFLVVVGMGNDENGNYFRVYENATSDKSEGTAPNNKLYYNSECSKIEGIQKFDNSYSESVRCYVVSQVRESIKK